MQQARRVLPGEPAEHRRAGRPAGPARRGRAADAQLDDAPSSAPSWRSCRSRRSATRGWPRRWRSSTPSCRACGRGRTGRRRGGSAATTRSGMGEATRAMEELGRLDALAEQLSQSYPGASLEDIDLDELEAQLGEQARVDARALAELERELRRQGLFERMPDGSLRLSPKALRGWGSRRCATSSTGSAAAAASGRPAAPAPSGEPTGATRPWAFGDTEAWHVPRTLTNAALRRAAGDTAAAGRHRRRDRRDRAAQPGGGGAVRRHVVVDGAGRALGADEAHRAGPAPADLHPVPRRRAEADHVRAARPRRRAGRADRPGGRLRAGHEPAPRPAARRPAPAPPPRRAARGAGGDRRRADRAPGARRLRRVRLPAVARRRWRRRWRRWTG